MASIKVEPITGFVHGKHRTDPKGTRFQGRRARSNIAGLRRQVKEQQKMALQHREQMRSHGRTPGLSSVEMETPTTKSYHKVDIPESETRHARKAIQVNRISEKAARRGIQLSPKEAAGRLGQIAKKAGRLPGILGPLGTVGAYQEFRGSMKRMKKKGVMRDDAGNIIFKPKEI